MYQIRHKNIDIVIWCLSWSIYPKRCI